MAFALTQLTLRERFMAALTHDLRNPLSNALVSAELIKRSSDLEKMKEFATMIIDNLNRMDGMIRDLLDSARYQTGERLQLHLEEFDMQDVAKEVYDQFTVTHGPRFQIIANPGPGCWDRDAIKRAIENVLSNAVKYGGAGTPIRIKIDSTNGRVLLSVHNEGDPIPPDHIEGIFQVFRRANAAKEGRIDGWGIGLAYVRSVVESHGGSIAVDSSISRGTTFTMDLPADASLYLNTEVPGRKPG
jgi:signal transduction histidine kinase